MPAPSPLPIDEDKLITVEVQADRVGHVFMESNNGTVQLIIFTKDENPTLVMRRLGDAARCDGAKGDGAWGFILFCEFWRILRESLSKQSA